MNRNRRTHIDHLPLKPPGGVVESKLDRYGRISFYMPDLRSLLALEIPMHEDPLAGLKRSISRRDLEPRKVVY